MWAYYTLILKHSGELFAFGDNIYGQLGLGNNIEKINTPTLIMKDEPIQQITCGSYHTFILKKSGELFAFGRNRNGQLGLGNNDDRNVPTLVMKDKSIQQIVCGGLHTFIFKNSGELFAFGDNKYGQLGLGDYENRIGPTLVMEDKSIQQIACGSFHSLV